MSRDTKSYDVLVMGMGYAGLASALFVAGQDLRVAICGASGGLDFSSGLIDLMAVYPVNEGRVWRNPWKAIEALLRESPAHPYGLLQPAEIKAALDEFGAFMAGQGLPYKCAAQRNSPVLTPAGTIKQSYLTPQTVWNGSLASLDKAPTLLVGFEGLKGFSARQIHETQRRDWPALQHVQIKFPGKTGELHPEHLALALSDQRVRRELAGSLKGMLPDVEYIGFPAILGLSKPVDTVAHLEELTGKKIFEIPTIPPGLAGIRLRTAFNRGLAGLGVGTYSQKRVTHAQSLGARGWQVRLGPESTGLTIEARAVILATGRFMGGGLVASRTSITEPVFGLPVFQPDKRDDWRRGEFFDPAGHPVSRSGLQTDKEMRPLSSPGRPVENLYAAGTILAHHDWAREKCGAGMAIATAYKAVKSLTRRLKAGGA